MWKQALIEHNRARVEVILEMLRIMRPDEFITFEELEEIKTRLKQYQTESYLALMDFNEANRHS